MIDLIGKHGSEMFAKLILSEENLEDLIHLLNFISFKFELILLTILGQDESYGFSDHFGKLLVEQIEKDIEDLLGYSNAQDFVDEKESYVLEMLEKFRSYGLTVHANLSLYGKYDWWHIGQDNYFREQMQKED